MVKWCHSGFGVYCGSAIWPHNEGGLENLARYIIRASLSDKGCALRLEKIHSVPQERMTYIAACDSSDGVAKVLYESKNGKMTQIIEALDWLAQLSTNTRSWIFSFPKNYRLDLQIIRF